MPGTAWVIHRIRGAYHLVARWCWRQAVLLPAVVLPRESKDVKHLARVLCLAYRRTKPCDLVVLCSYTSGSALQLHSGAIQRKCPTDAGFGQALLSSSKQHLAMMSSARKALGDWLLQGPRSTSRSIIGESYLKHAQSVPAASNESVHML